MGRIIFVLLALVANPTYPAFGNTTLHWSNWALSGLYNGIKRHPWLTGTAVGITALVATGVYILATLDMNDPDSTRRTQENLEKLTNRQRKKSQTMSEWTAKLSQLSSICTQLDLGEESIWILFDHENEQDRLQVKSTAEQMNDKKENLRSIGEDQLKEDIKIMEKQIKIANNLKNIKDSPEKQEKIREHYKKTKAVVIR